MSNSRKVLFFDIDGTLLYAKGSGRKAFQDAFYETYKIPINIDHINFSGATDLDVINKLLVENKIKDTQKKIPLFFDNLAKYLEFYLSKSPPVVLDGVKSFLEKIPSSWILSIITGNTQKCANIKLKRSNLYSFFPITGGYGDDSGCRNEIAKIAINRIEDFSSGYLFGDTPKDILAAKSNNLISVAIATGKHDYDELLSYKPDFIMNSFNDAKTILKDIY